MVARGSSFEAAAGACPFVALELDRDRRSDRPDYRHRCYAEQVPAPRTVAHQERYCLSPNFSGCPIFQAWAVRAAARPVPIPGGVAASVRRDEPGHDVEPEPAVAFAPVPLAVAGPVEADDFDVDVPTQTEAADADAEAPWPDSMGVPTVPGTGALGVPTGSRPTGAPGVPSERSAMAGSVATDTTWSAAATGEPPAEEEQLSVFDAPAPPPSAPAEPHEPVERMAPAPTFASTLPDETFGPQTTVRAATSRVPPAEYGDEPQASPRASVADYGDEPDGSSPVPAFLTGRSARPRPAVQTARVDRDDVVPSWDVDGRFGAQSGSRQPSGTHRGGMGNLLTAVAVAIIIGLGILAVLIIPGVLGGDSSQPTRRPTNIATAPASAQVTTVAVLPTASAQPTPTEARPTADPTPEASPILYRVKRGDSLERIARRNGTTVDAILAANPQIPSADAIQVGQVIVLPPPSE